MKTLAPNQAYTVFGAAWTGETEVTEVSVSTDGGQTWAQAEFVNSVQRYAWRRWKFNWVTPKKPGQYTLLSRAKDANGDVQPDKHDENYATYVTSLAGSNITDESMKKPSSAKSRTQIPARYQHFEKS